MKAEMKCPMLRAVVVVSISQKNVEHVQSRNFQVLTSGWKSVILASYVCSTFVLCSRQRLQSFSVVFVLLERRE